MKLKKFIRFIDKDWNCSIPLAMVDFRKNTKLFSFYDVSAYFWQVRQKSIIIDSMNRKPKTIKL